MAKKQFTLTQISGPTNIRKFTEKATQSYAIGEAVYESTGIKKLTGTVSTGIMGVAVRKGANVATPPAMNARVSVITPDQVWELHIVSNKKPTSLVMFGNYKLKYTSNASFAITRLDATASTTISVKGPVIVTTVAGTADQGLVVVGFSDSLGTKKGQKVLVRFAGQSGLSKT